jgi:hypothetical protein
MHASFGGSEVDQSTTQLVIDQIEELVVTIIEEIRARPTVALAILAAVVGVIIGGMLAGGVGQPKPVRQRVARRVSRMGDMAELTRLGVKLLENPIVRAAVLSQFKKRFL